MVDQLGLLRDTGESDHDGVTTDPTLAGHVTGDLTPGTVHVEFDHNFDFNAEGRTAVALDQSFQYDPRDAEPSLAGHEGTVTFQYRPYRLDDAGQRFEEGSWSSFGFVLEASAGTQLRVPALTLARDTGESDRDRITSDPTVSGRVVHDGDPNLDVGGVRIELDRNDDGAADDSVTSGSQGEFTWTPSDLQPGSVTVAARPVERDQAGDTDVAGPWTRLSFTLQATNVPRVVELNWDENDEPPTTGEGGIVASGIVVQGRISAPPDGSASGEVQFDLNGDASVDGRATSDEEGRFRYRIASPGAGTVRVRARGTHYDAVTDTTTFGPWFAEEFQVEPTVDPEIADLQLVAGRSDEFGNVSADTPAVAGAVRGVTAATDARVQWDHDADGSVDGYTRPDASGQFVYHAAGVQPGPVRLRARAVAWDQRLGAYQEGDWAELTFTLTPPPRVEPLAPRLTLLHDTGDSADDRITSDPTVLGNIAVGSGEDGSGELAAASRPAAGLLTVELDFDGDRQFDALTTADETGQFRFVPPAALGPLTVAARARYWDSARQQGQLGPWGQLSFTLRAPRTEPVVIERWELASDSGDSQEDQVTANPLLIGRTTESSDSLGIVVEVDEDGDGTADGSATVAEDGSFSYDPAPEPSGPRTVRARAVVWDPVLQVDLPGPWSGLTFTVEPEPATAARITEVSVPVIDQAGVVTYPQIVGRVVNENALEGVTIELDFDGDGTVEQTTSTDSLGRFAAHADALPDGEVEVFLRSRELDAGDGAVLYSEWTSLAFTLQRAAPAEATLAELRLAHDTGGSDDDGRTWDATVVGRIEFPATSDSSEPPGTPDPSGTQATVAVHFDHDGDGIVDGTAAAGLDGRFTYEPARLLPGNIALRARTRRQSLTDGVQVGDWNTLHFVLEPPPAAAPRVTRLELVHDTGQSANDGSTSDPRVRGIVEGVSVVGVSGTAAPLAAVELDTDGDGAPDAHAEVDEQGIFVYTPEGLAEGLVRLAARPENSPAEDAPGGKASESAWRELTFVYAQDPDSEEALRLAGSVAAHGQLRPDARSEFDTALQRSESDYAQARQVALQQHDALVEQADRQRKQITAAADANLQQTTQDADNAYARAVADAGVRLSESLGDAQSNPADYEYRAFVWPDAPPGIPPALAARPVPPVASLEFQDRADYDLAKDRVYGEQVATAESDFSQAVSTADHQRRQDQERATRDYEQAVHAAHTEYRRHVATADRILTEAKAGFQPPRDASEIDRDHAARRQQAAQQRDSRLQVHAANFDSAVRAALNVESDAVASAERDYERRNDEATQSYFAVVSDPNVTPEAIEQAERTYLEELAEHDVLKSTAISQARLQNRETHARETQRRETLNADAQRDYVLALSASQRLHREELAHHERLRTDALETARFDHRLALASAKRSRALALHAAEREWAAAQAMAAERHAVAVAIAEKTLLQARAQSREAAIRRFAEFDANAWSEYQQARAAYQVEYVTAQTTGFQEYSTALAAAQRERSVGNAGALRDQRDALARADHQRELEQAQQLRDYGFVASVAAESRTVAEEHAWTQRSDDLAEAERTLQVRLAEKNYDVAVQIAETEREFERTLSQIQSEQPLDSDPAESARRESLARHARDVSNLKTLQAGDQRGLNAREARDEARAEADRRYVVGYLDAQRRHESSLTAARDLLEQQLASADRDHRLAAATAQGTSDEQTASLENVWRGASGSAVNAFETNTIEAAAARLTADAAAERQGRLALASDHVAVVSDWAALWQTPTGPTPWANYHQQLAHAELDRVTAVGDGRVLYAEQLADAQVTWVLDVGIADQSLNDAHADAYQTQVTQVVAAADQLAAVGGSAQLTYDLLASQRTARHDLDVLDANYRQAVDRAGDRARFERDFAAAGWELERERESAELQQELARRETELAFLLGNLTAQQRNSQLRDARTRLDDRLLAAEQNRKQAEAAAEVSRLRAEALREQTWSAEVGNLKVTWTDGLGSAAEALSVALHQAALDFSRAETQAGIQFASQTAAANQQHQVATAVAGAERGERVAAAEGGLDEALVSAAFTADGVERGAENALEIAELTDYAAALRTRSHFTGTPLADYRQTVAEARQAWATQVGAARDAYRQELAGAATSYAQAGNAADQVLARSLHLADVTIATGMASAEARRTIDYARAAGDVTLAQSQALFDKGVESTRSGRQYQTTLARAEQNFEDDVAAARAAWIGAIAEAEAARYLAGETVEAQARYETAEAAASVAWGQALGDARWDWVDAAGTAGVVRAAQWGDAEVARAVAFGRADMAFAQAVGDSVILYTAQATGHEEQWVQATTLAHANHQNALAAGAGDWIDNSAAASSDLLVQSGAAQVTMSVDLANAEATHHAARAAQRAERRAAELLEAGSLDAGIYGAAESRALADWLVNLSDDYVAFARSTAEADADHRQALGNAAADLDRARSATELQFVQQRGALEFTHASNQVAAWGAYERTLVMHENRRRDAAARADSSLDQAYAEAERRRAVEEANAERQYQLGLAEGNPDAAAIREAQVEIAASERTMDRARADHAWRASVGANQSQFQSEHATAALALRTAVVGFDQRYYAELAAAGESQQLRDAGAEADYAVTEFAAIGTLRERLAMETATLHDLMSLEESRERQEVAESLETPASRWQAEMAAARHQAGGRQQATLLQWNIDVHTAQADYQRTVAEAYRMHASASAAAGAGWIRGTADVVADARLDRGRSDQAYFLAHQAAVDDFTATMNAADRDRRLRIEMARQTRAAGGSERDFESARNAVARDFEAARDTAHRQFAAAEIAAHGQRSVAAGRADHEFVATTTAADREFAVTIQALDQAFAETESAADAVRRQLLTDADSTAWVESADALAEELGRRALETGLPRLGFEAERSVAQRQRAESRREADTRHALETASATRSYESQWFAARRDWEQAATIAETSRAEQQASAQRERAEREAAADATHPDAVEVGRLPELPRPRPGLQQTRPAGSWPTAPGAELDLDVIASLPLFTGSREAPRFGTRGLQPAMLLQSRRLRTGPPSPAEDATGRHQAHLTSGAPEHALRYAAADAGAVAVGRGMPSVGQLLELAANANRPATASRDAVIHHAASVQLALGALVLRDAPDPGDFRDLKQWLEAERTYRQQLGRDVLQNSSEAHRRLWFGIREAVAADYFAEQHPDYGAIGAPADPADFARQLAEDRFANLGFWQRRLTLRHWEETTDQFWFGEFSDNVTVEGTAGEVGLSVTGFDLPMDLRDLYYQGTHWEWSWNHVGKTGLYTVSMLPVVGVLKNAKHLEHVKHADSASSLTRSIDRVAAMERRAAGHLAPHGDESQRLLLELGGESCFVAGTRVLVAVVGPAMHDRAAQPAEQAGLFPWRYWTSLGLIGLGGTLSLQAALRSQRSQWLPEASEPREPASRPRTKRSIPGRHGRESPCSAPHRRSRHVLFSSRFLLNPPTEGPVRE